jgi:hypothetical protein
MTRLTAASDRAAPRTPPPRRVRPGKPGPAVTGRAPLPVIQAR